MGRPWPLWKRWTQPSAVDREQVNTARERFPSGKAVAKRLKQRPLMSFQHEIWAGTLVLEFCTLRQICACFTNLSMIYGAGLISIKFKRAKCSRVATIRSKIGQTRVLWEPNRFDISCGSSVTPQSFFEEVLNHKIDVHL